MSELQVTESLIVPKIVTSLYKKAQYKNKLAITSLEDVSKEKQKSNKNLKKPRVSVVSQEITLVHCSCDRLQNELFEFIDDFITSQEYKDYADFKASIITKDVAVQYDANDLKVIEKVLSMDLEEQIDLTTRALRVFVMERQIEKYATNLENLVHLKKQEEAIALIRRKIAEVKSVFFCHRKQREERRKAKRKAIIQKFIRAHNIDVSGMLSTNRLDLVILDVERKLRMKRKMHKNNRQIIVEKLLKEFRQKQSKNKVERKIRRRSVEEERRGIFHLKGKVNSVDLISSVHIPHSADNKILKAFKDAGVCIKKYQPTDKRLSRDTNDKTEEMNASRVASSVLDEYSQQYIGSDKLYEDGLYKFSLEDYIHKKIGSDLMQSFVEFENALEARYFFALCEKERKEKEKTEISYPDDTAFVVKPKRINFNNFKHGRIYRKQIVLINTCGHAVKIRLLKIYTEDLRQSVCFELEEDELKVVRPGLPLKYTLIFRPVERMDVVVGSLIFLVCNKLSYYRRIVPIDCVPFASEVTINPKIILFGVIPIWKFQKQPLLDVSKVVKIKSSGNSSYKIVVKKVLDPLELDSIISDDDDDDDDESSSDLHDMSKTQAQYDVETILIDILREVDSDFRVDKRFLTIDGNADEQLIKVSLSDEKHPGFFMEKYQFDIYEVDDANGYEYRGVQEITLTLDVSSYPIEFNSLCVDFGLCFFGISYQTKLVLTNNSNLIQPIAVRVPSSLSYYVSADKSNAFVRSGETREFAIQFLPSHDIVTDKNRFYDPETHILCFPIQIKLLNKQYADAPPLVQQTYAILCDCADLKLDPTHTYHYGLIDDRMVLDVGKCSVNETVTTQIILRNPCCSKIYYCFKNLPKYITIMPKYGVGSIGPCQEMKLKIFIHPQLDDFQGEGMYTHIFKEDKQFQISIDTIGKIGKYRKKPDMARLLKLLKMILKELRKPEDIDILEDICNAVCTWRVEMVPCTCESTLRTDTAESKQEICNEETLIDLKTFEYDNGGRQPENSAVGMSAVEFQIDARKNSNVSSKSSVVPTDVKLENDSNQSHNASKKKKRKSTRRTTKLPDSSTFPTYSSLLMDEPPDDESAEKKPDDSSSRDLVFQIPANSSVDFDRTLSNVLQIKTVFVRPLYEFSYNYVEFPATPGASYSVMMTELRPLKYFDKSCRCGFEPKRETPNYRAIFRIAGSTEEVKIEPTYGVLEDNESITLILVATPKINDDVVATYAFERKKSLMLQEKITQWKQKREAELLAKRKKQMKTKKKRSKSKNTAETEEPPAGDETPPIVSSDDVEVGILDFYPAEIAIWRSIEPYFLNANLVCHVEYEMEDCWYHPPDVFSLETVCKVIPPDFIHDQKSQHLDFGQVAVGESKKMIITVQNIKYSDIVVKTSILRPHGSFRCPNFDSVMLPGESFLKIPITYTPIKGEKIIEYMDIKAERTVYQFMLTAEGIGPEILIAPPSKIIRVISRKGKTVEVPFEIINNSNIPVTVYFEKVCELEGRITSVPLDGIEEEIKVEKKGKKKKEKKKPSKTPSRVKVNEINYSDELLENEIYSIENNFEKTRDLSRFGIKDETGKTRLMEGSKNVVKLLFGRPGKLRYPSPVKGKANKKKDRISSGSLSIGAQGKTFIAKFNILYGTSIFLKDFIIIGEFK